MPKARKNRFYAVRRGKEGPHVYSSWEEAKSNVIGFPGAIHKSFPTQAEAEIFMNGAPGSRYIYIQDLPPDPESLRELPDISGNRQVSSKVSSPSLYMQTFSVEVDGHSDTAYGQRETCDVEMTLSKSSTKTTTVPSEADMSGGTFPDMNPKENAAPRPIAPSLPPPSITLSDEQREILKIVMSGRSVFFTGSAGTGKSVLLRAIIEQCRAEFSDNGQLAITAATGIASVNIGGCTLHSWAGVGLGKEPADRLVGKLWGKHKSNKKGPVRRWRRVRTLIVDEISMIDGVFFDKLEYVARELRQDDSPFGGIQLVLSGDFCQLPPVPDRGENGAPVPATFAFDAHSWTHCMGKPVVLRQIFRQSDQKFIDMLESLRFARLTPQIIAEFKKLSRPIIYDDGIDPTELFPLRIQAEDANNFRLQQLEGPPHVYQANDTPGWDRTGRPYARHEIQPALDRLVAPEEITLKVGAQVMLIMNMVQGKLVNGSVGRVVTFSTPRDGRECGTEIANLIKQEDMGYSAKPEYHALDEAIERGTWPIVQFQAGRKLLCIPAIFEATNAEGTVEATREQVPLILAWALSIHKSQGQTLERVRVDLGRAFEKGQVYIALSRARKLETLEVQSFRAEKVMAHPRVSQWMSETMGITGTNPTVEESDDDDELYWGGLDD